MTLKTFIKKTWFLNRVTVGKDTKFVSQLIQKEYGGNFHTFDSGEECLTWIIPKAWDVEEALLVSPNGEKIADFNENPLSLCSYSIPFHGKLELRELKDHLYTNDLVPTAIPYHYRWQYQYGEKCDWGFSLPFNIYKSLREGEYEVRIKTNFKTGKMYVNDIYLPGKNSETVFFCAHTCHPAMVNDGIANVGVALKILKYLKSKENSKYSYRFIFGPEYFTGAAYLSRFGKNNLKYGFYLDMLGNNEPLCFSKSFGEDCYIDKVTKIVFNSLHKDYVEYDYRGIWGNDEMFYDGPGFRIPMVCIGRQKFANYHFSADNLRNCNFEYLGEAKDLLIKIVETIENDKKIRLKYKGPLYFSRYYNEIFSNKNIASNKLQEIQILLDNGLFYSEIAYKLGISFEEIKKIGNLLLKLRLAEEIK